jgi:hypothetical protein
MLRDAVKSFERQASGGRLFQLAVAPNEIMKKQHFSSSPPVFLYPQKARSKLKNKLQTKSPTFKLIRVFPDLSE